MYGDLCTAIMDFRADPRSRAPLPTANDLGSPATGGPIGRA